MRLNDSGFAQWSLMAAIGMIVIGVILTLPRNNDYPDIPPMKAAQKSVSDTKKVEVRAGENILILGAQKNSSKKQVMLLVQNSKGERDFFSPDVITEKEYQKLIPLLKHSAFSNSPSIFCRKTITRNAIEAIPLGISLFQMDSILVPTNKVLMENGVLKAKYLRMEVFDKKSGKFYMPVMSFSGGKYTGCELISYRKTHMNAWLLKFLPGTDWTYDHNIFNKLYQTKAFGALNTKDAVHVTFKKNFLVALMLLVIAVMLVVVIFAFYAVIPLAPAYTFYGLLLFPPLFKPFDRTFTSIVIIMLTVVCYYYTWLTFMPYMSFFLMPFILIPTALGGVSMLLADDICKKCRYMNTYGVDHEDFLGEHIEKKRESSRKRIDRRKVGSGSRWDETTHQTVNRNTGRVIDEYKTKSNIRNYNIYENTYQTDNFICTYNVKSFKVYEKCQDCGNIRTYTRNEWELIDKEYNGSSISVSRTEE